MQACSGEDWIVGEAVFIDIDMKLKSISCFGLRIECGFDILEAILVLGIFMGSVVIEVDYLKLNGFSIIHLA